MNKGVFISNLSLYLYYTLHIIIFVHSNYFLHLTSNQTQVSTSNKLLEKLISQYQTLGLTRMTPNSVPAIEITTWPDLRPKFSVEANVIYLWNTSMFAKRPITSNTNNNFSDTGFSGQQTGL